MSDTASRDHQGIDGPDQRPVDFVFLVLAAVFLASLVVCNVIANKFLTVDLGWLGFSAPFVLSAGALPYPITFLATDLLSELYGHRRANQVVLAGFAASVFTLLALWLGGQFDAIADSPVSNATYAAAFSNTWRVIVASMTAYLVAQFVDVQLFHFWRRLTKGRHLWLRNNASTIVSQLLDSVLVVLVLFLGDEKWPSERLVATIFDLWLFKALVALADTPLFYAGTIWLQKLRMRPL